MMSTVRNDNSRFPIPFTSNQWQELEHQALVYKYMISGMPVPPDLIFSIKRSLDSSTKLILHHHSPHQSVGWNSFQIGIGRKIDPEPGRCRRTDGKKWRCSKDAYPDSKYCERHMHRGRNRSRKPVETIPLSTICTKSPNYPSSTSNSPFVHPQLSSSSRSCGNVLSSQDQFLLESSVFSHSEKDQSYGMKEGVDEHPFLSKTCSIGPISASTSRNSWPSLAQLKQRAFSDYQNDYSYLQLQNSPTQQNQNNLSLNIEEKGESEKVMHHFFDESPHNDDHVKDKDSSTTRLSISIPSTSRDFFQTHDGNFTFLEK